MIDMTESILAITGPTSGIGRETVKALAHTFQRIILICRNMDKAETLTQELLELNPSLKVDTVKCDLSDLSSVRQAAKVIKEQFDHIDCLVNNAGMVSKSGQTSPDGYELMMATNYLSHFLLTHELLPLVMHSEHRQVVIVSSDAYKFAPMKRPFFKPTHSSAIAGYGRSKLGTLYLAQELHEMYSRKGLKTTAVHPGMVSTNIGRNAVSKKVGNVVFKLLDPFFLNMEEGARPVVLAVLHPDKFSGFYSNEGAIAPVKKHGSDFKMRREFIDATLKELDLDSL